MFHEGLTSIDFVTKSIFFVSIVVPAIIFFAIHAEVKKDGKNQKKNRK